MHGANLHFKHIRGRSVASVASCTSCNSIILHERMFTVHDSYSTPMKNSLTVCITLL